MKLWCVARFGIICTIWSLRKAQFCNFTKSNTPPWVFSTFFKLYKWYQIVQSISIILSTFYFFWTLILVAVSSRKSNWFGDVTLSTVNHNYNGNHMTFKNNCLRYYKSKRLYFQDFSTFYSKVFAKVPSFTKKKLQPNVRSNQLSLSLSLSGSLSFFLSLIYYSTVITELFR